VHNKKYNVKFCSNDISGVSSEWHRPAPSKTSITFISTLEIWSVSDVDSLALISQFLSYIHMGLILQLFYLQWAD
jgi:hypothetical protein